MSRTVSEVLEMINESIVDLMHNIKTMKDERGYEVDEYMAELRFLLDEYRNLYHAWDLSVLHHRTKEMYMD
jgi:hypothetical protein